MNPFFSRKRLSRPKLLLDSPERPSEHRDGSLREARINHPKGVAVDDKNIYVADIAIRKITSQAFLRC